MPTKRNIFQKLAGTDSEEDGILAENEELLEREISLAGSDEEEEENINFGGKKDMFNSDTECQLTLDVYQTDNEIVIKSTIAGVKPEDLDITINNDMVTIKGERKNEERVKTENYFYQECYWGAFSRSVILPIDVETDQAEAVLKNGVLTIRLPKIEKVKSKKLQVKGA